MSITAAELRMQAVRRLGDIAGYDERLDVKLTLARPMAVEVLIRQALRAARGDELLTQEIRQLAGVGLGRAWALDDAIHAGGLPEPTVERPEISLEEFAQTIREELSA